MIDKKCIGIVINKTNYKDNDAIFNILTAEGVETFNARGILKVTSKNASSCNYFMISEFILQSKSENSNKTLKSSSIIKMYKKPYEDILVSSTYLAICSLLNQVSNEINGYDLAIKCFDYLEKDASPINVLNYFLKNLCDALGYNPNIKGCVSCGSKNNLISFDFESGGFICESCFLVDRYERLPQPFLKELYSFLKTDDYLEIDDSKAERLLMMYASFLRDIVGLKIDAINFALKCI